MMIYKMRENLLKRLLNSIKSFTFALDSLKKMKKSELVIETTFQELLAGQALTFSI